MKTRGGERGLDLRGEESRDRSGGCEAVCGGEEEPGFWISGRLLVSTRWDLEARGKGKRT
jgi:hypothetical protein